MLSRLRNKTTSTTVTSDRMNKQRRYEALVRALHGDLYRYACWLVHDPVVAEDLLQETFLRAWKALDSLNDEHAAKAWLITILRRENARRFERKQFELSELDHDTTIDAHNLGPAQQTEQHLLRQKIAQLSPEYREPLVLQVLYGFNGEEIAALLKLNRNTVMTRLFRARKQLRDAVTEPPKSWEQHNG